VKEKKDSFLRVVYVGNIGCTHCCKRFFFTFNGEECKDPAAVDGALDHTPKELSIRPANIEGYCGSIANGKVKVEFQVRDCDKGSENQLPFPKKVQVSRIIVEEVDKPQAPH